MSNALQTQAQVQSMDFSTFIHTPAGQNMISRALPDVRQQQRFVASIAAAVTSNPDLQRCTNDSIISAALQGISLGLSPSPQLGQFYMVPYKDNKNGTTTAQFQIGYRGLIQLAIRSGQYRNLDAKAIKQGEFKGLDPLTGDPVFEFISDYYKREKLNTVGFMAYFELVNGFRKVIYWPFEAVVAYADRYSPAFSKESTTVNTRNGPVTKMSFADYLAHKPAAKDEWLYSSFWYKDFDVMACKTLLRQLIQKWGPMSIDMQDAVMQDSSSEILGDGMVDVYDVQPPVA